jgi:Fe-S cluster biogenesis protein NfuA
VNPHARTDTNGDAIRDRIGRIETLIAELERSADAAAQAQSRAIVQAVLDFHAAALDRLLRHVTAIGSPGAALLETLARDELVSSLLLLHDLHPDDLAARVARALDQVRPQLRSHGGDVELVALKRGIVRLRLRGACHSCPSSSATLRDLIEAALYGAAPDVAGIEVEEAAGAADEVVPPLVTIGPPPAGHA